MPARGYVRLQYELHLHQAGPFSQTIPLYVADDGLRIMELTLRGVAEAASE